MCHYAFLHVYLTVGRCDSREAALSAFEGETLDREIYN